MQLGDAPPYLIRTTFFGESRRIARSILEPDMGEVIRFIPRSELERARLIREARVIYDSIFPPVDVMNEPRDDMAPRRQD